MKAGTFKADAFKADAFKIRTFKASAVIAGTNTFKVDSKCTFEADTEPQMHAKQVQHRRCIRSRYSATVALKADTTPQ